MSVPAAWLWRGRYNASPDHACETTTGGARPGSGCDVVHRVQPVNVPQNEELGLVVRVVALTLGTWLVCSLWPVAAEAGQRTPRAETTSASNEDPPPPVAPEMVSRGENGRVVMRATRLTEPLRVDGRLDEPLYQSVEPVSGFVQSLPDTGAPSSEKTEVWVAFDASNLYVSCRCYESSPPNTWVANELRRDGTQLRQNDTFGVLFDTFHDRRNGFFFYTNPIGGFSDQAVTDEGNPNIEWNPVWEVRTGRFDGGWTVEMAIPFKSIRYNQGKDQVWGIQFRRLIRRKYEWTYLTPLPAAIGAFNGILRVSRAATLLGVDVPDASRNVELKPYGISRLATDRVSSPPTTNQLSSDVGLDAKYGVTSNLTADLTVNTDFAQVEVDEQQVNLTRFSLQLPEKRDFFLEGRGILDFARTGPATFGGGSGNASATPGVNTGAMPQLFYTRRIGLSGGREIPLRVGGRLTGRVGKFSIGMLNIETGEEAVSGTPATNFSVVRVKRDILRRSSIGVMATRRSRSVVAANGGNEAYGADASFAFFQNVSLGGYYARTRTPGLEGDDDSYQGRFDYGADRYGVQAQHLKVGDHFNPEVGFVRRDNFRRSFGSLRFSPRPHKAGIRQVSSVASLEYIENGAGRLETRTLDGRVNVEMNNSDQFSVEARGDYELLVNPFTISGVTIPVGGAISSAT